MTLKLALTFSNRLARAVYSPVARIVSTLIFLRSMAMPRCASSAAAISLPVTAPNRRPFSPTRAVTVTTAPSSFFASSRAFTPASKRRCAAALFWMLAALIADASAGDASLCGNR